MKKRIMRKRKYTLLDYNPVPYYTHDDTHSYNAEEEASIPTPVISNIVSTAQIVSTQMPLNLELIKDVLPGSAYDRRKFAAMTIRLADPNCTLLLFSSGKLVVAGGRNWYECVLSCLSVAKMLEERLYGIGFWLKSCEIQNIVGHVVIPIEPGGCLDLESIYSRLNLLCMYQPNTFPGLIYRPESSPVTLLCFHSGKIVIAGGKTIRDVTEGWKRLWPIIKVFIKNKA